MFLVILFLVLDVLLNGEFINSHSGHEVPSGPEMITLETPVTSHEIAGYSDSTLALDKPNDVGHRVLRWYPYQHMHVIAH